VKQVWPTKRWCFPHVDFWRFTDQICLGSLLCSKLELRQVFELADNMCNRWHLADNHPSLRTRLNEKKCWPCCDEIIRHDVSKTYEVIPSWCCALCPGFYFCCAEQMATSTLPESSYNTLVIASSTPHYLSNVEFHSWHHIAST
jgi:hypothetical protein